MIEKQLDPFLSEVRSIYLTFWRINIRVDYLQGGMQTTRQILYGNNWSVSILIHQIISLIGKRTSFKNSALRNFQTSKLKSILWQIWKIQSLLEATSLHLYSLVTFIWIVCFSENNSLLTKCCTISRWTNI